MELLTDGNAIWAVHFVCSTIYGPKFPDEKWCKKNSCLCIKSSPFYTNLAIPCGLSALCSIIQYSYHQCHPTPNQLAYCAQYQMWVFLYIVHLNSDDVNPWLIDYKRIINNSIGKYELKTWKLSELYIDIYFININTTYNEMHMPL